MLAGRVPGHAGAETGSCHADACLHEYPVLFAACVRGMMRAATQTGKIYHILVHTERLA